MEHFSIKSGYGEKDVEDFINAFHDVGEFKPFDFTLTTFWGEAASKAAFASERRYVLLKDGDPIGVFQGLVEKKLFYKNIRAGSTSGNGIAVLPGFSKDIMCFFLQEILKRERFSDYSIFTPFSLNLRNFLEKLHYTLYIDLTLEMDKIFQNMDKKTRNRVRKAEKLGVAVDFDDSLDALKKAYNVISLTSTERLFSTPPWSYTVSLHESFKRDGCHSIVASSYGENGDVASAAHLIGFDRKMVLWQAGSTEEGYKLNAGSFVQAEVIKWSKGHGYLIYDMGGTNPKESIYAGIHRFKSGFGGSLVTNTHLQRRAFYVPLAARIHRSIRGFGLKLPV